MFKSYLKIVFRSFLKNKASTIINLIGLSIAFALFILLILYANNELTTDLYHKKADRIYRVLETEKRFISTGAKFGPYIANSFPEVEEVCRMYFDGGTFTHEDKEVSIDNIAVVDSNYFKIFTHEIIFGDLQKSLNGNRSVVLSETASKKIFGDKNPIGQVVNWGKLLSLTVNAVIKDTPQNSSIQFDAYISFMCLEIRNENALNYDGNWSLTTWVLLKQNSDLAALEKKMSVNLNSEFGQNNKFGLQNLKDIYLNASVDDDNIRHGNLQLIQLFIGLAFFILIIASINYINLTTAQAAIRAREVGIRKVVGAHKTILIVQFLIESCVLVFISLLIGFLLAEFFIPTFNILASTALKVKTFYTGRYIITFIGGGILLGIAAGIYPAFVLSFFHPLDVIRGKITKSKGSLMARKALLIFQFTMAMIMIVATITIYRQINFVKHLDLGFNKEKKILIRTKTNLVREGKAFKDDLLAIAGVDMISVCNGVPGEVNNGMGSTINGREIRMAHLLFDENYIDLMGIEILKGHSFTRDSSDINKAYLLNESAVKYLETKDPFDLTIWKSKCIGIVKDFNFASLHQPIAPLFMTYGSYMRDICVRFSGSDISGILKKTEAVWNKYFPKTPFNYRFIDDIVDKQYHAEEQMGKILGYFTLFTLFIAAIGILGLTSFIIQQRTKEIGIRKVHGCSTTQIIRMFSFDFLKWLVIAFIISIPLSWYLVDYWLQNFSYRISIDWWVFGFSGLISLIISSFTIIIFVYKAAIMNPVDTLRYE